MCIRDRQRRGARPLYEALGDRRSARARWRCAAHGSAGASRAAASARQHCKQFLGSRSRARARANTRPRALVEYH
eukprot:2431496-Alexandrium_andersonii.AAC.1